MFTDEILEKCCCTQEQLNEAIQKGEKIIMGSVDGLVTAYKYNDKLYLASIVLIP